MKDIRPKKSLGQHWLHDKTALQAICDAAQVVSADTVLEIGPGLGTLTAFLAERARHVVAVEFDAQLAVALSQQVPANVTVQHLDILKFNLGTLPPGYKVVANVPYYITSKITRFLLESANPPNLTTLLVQKEVAERMAAQPGAMSMLAVAVQFYTEPTLGPLVPAQLFTPPPKVDSQVISLQRRVAPLFAECDPKKFFRLVRAGFGEKRKKLRNALSGGLQIDKLMAEQWIKKADIPPDARAEQLSLEDWYRLYKSW